SSHRKDRAQALTVAQTAEQLNRSSIELLDRPRRVPHEKMSHAKHLKGLGHALSVGSRFKQRQRLLVCLKRLLDPTCIHQPVTQAVETLSTQRWVSKFLGHRQRLA